MSRPPNEVVVASWRWVRGAAARLQRRLRRTAAPVPNGTAGPAASDGGGDARTRFWAEFRAGQREAATRSAQRRPR